VHSLRFFPQHPIETTHMLCGLPKDPAYPVGVCPQSIWDKTKPGQGEHFLYLCLDLSHKSENGTLAHDLPIPTIFPAS
jgi:hypothetical protein